MISPPDLSKATYGTLLRLLWGHIQPRRRVQLGLLMAASVVSAAIRAANFSVNARLSALIASDLGVEGYRRSLRWCIWDATAAR